MLQGGKQTIYAKCEFPALAKRGPQSQEEKLSPSRVAYDIFFPTSPNFHINMRAIADAESCIFNQ